MWNPRQPAGEIFYQRAESVYSVKVVNGRRVGEPTRLFSRESTADETRNWDTRDGERFLVAPTRRVPPHLNVVRNWFEELKAKVPVR